MMQPWEEMDTSEKNDYCKALFVSVVPKNEQKLSYTVPYQNGPQSDTVLYQNNPLDFYAHFFY